MSAGLINLIVTEPSVYTPVRTQSYRMILRVSLSTDNIEGRFGFLGNALFVVQEHENGVVDFLRVAEPRDLSLPVEGPLRRTSTLDVYVTAKALGEEMLAAIVSDLETLVEAHVAEGVTVTHVAQAPAVTLVDANQHNSAAIDGDGKLYCWGDNTYGQNNIPDAARQGVVSVSCGAGFVLALRADGSCVQWGRNTFFGLPPWDVPEEIGQEPYGRAISISCGQDHLVALTENGYIVSWGSNRNFSTLGGPYNQTLTKYIRYQPDAVAISAGWFMTAVLLSDGNIRSWGAGGQGQRPGDSVSASESVTTGGGYKKVFAGYRGTTGVTLSDTVDVWGAYDDPPEGLTGVDTATVGHSTILVRTYDGQLVAWGASWSNVIRMLDGDPALAQLPEDPLLTYTAAVASKVGFHAAALLSNGKVINIGRGSFVEPHSTEGQGAVPPEIAY